jgi:membrane-associated phospholipid phosphatase
MLFSIFFIGGHYLTDMIAGAMLAGLGIRRSKSTEPNGGFSGG